MQLMVGCKQLKDGGGGGGRTVKPRALSGKRTNSSKDNDLNNMMRRILEGFGHFRGNIAPK